MPWQHTAGSPSASQVERVHWSGQGPFNWSQPADVMSSNSPARSSSPKKWSNTTTWLQRNATRAMPSTKMKVVQQHIGLQGNPQYAQRYDSQFRSLPPFPQILNESSSITTLEIYTLHPADGQGPPQSTGDPARYSAPLGMSAGWGTSTCRARATPWARRLRWQRR